MNQSINKGSSVMLFYSSAPEDEALCNELEKHLSLLRRQGVITTWSNRQIIPGTDWTQEVDVHISNASIILLLISPDFLASDYCYGVEMQRALDRHKHGLTQIIPILLRPVDRQDAPFSHLQYLPSNNQPVTLWENRDAAFLDIVSGIRASVAKVRATSVLGISHSSSPNNRERLILLKRVRAFWIQGMLEQSLHKTALIALELQEQPDALANPWSLIVQETAQAAHQLPSGTPIIQAYDEADGKLLILGEPGSGKTTLLLELARSLLDRAERDEAHPIPVIFHLSSWANKRESLIDWLAEELKQKYQVSSQLAKSWLSTDFILPLLDGLDEVTPVHRVACLNEINTYQGEHNFASLVVCSRSKEYFSQKTFLQLHSAVTVQPLTTQQIDDYLANAGEQLATLRTVLSHDTALLTLATNPFFLSILTLTYHGKMIEELPTTGTIEMRRRQIFAAYVKRMFEHRGAVSDYTVQQTIDWLKWLASRMAQNHQTEFHIENMQPDWLWEKNLRRWYEWTVGRPLIYALRVLFSATYSGLVAILVAILVDIIIIGINRELLGILIGIFPGVLISLVSGIVRGWRKGFYIAVAGIPTGAIFGALTSYLFLGLNKPAMGLIVGLVTGGIVEFIAFSIDRKGYSGIFPELVVGWSWREVKLSINRNNKILQVGLVLGGVGSFLVAATVSFENGIVKGLGVEGLMILAGLLLFILGSGIQSKSISKHIMVTHNQWLRLSLLQGLYVCLAVGFCAFIGTWLVISIVNVAGNSFGWIYALIAGLAFGIATASSSSWVDCLRHLVLRKLLWRRGSIPRNYAHFLDYAVERIFLRKIGSGYIFVHRLLLEYFAISELETRYIQLAKLGKKEAIIYHNQGQVYAAFGRYKQAIVHFTHAIELAPKEATFYIDRGLAHFRCKEHQQAIEDYTRAIALDTKNADLHYQRGRAYHDFEAYNKAIADFTKTIELNPKRAFSYGERAHSYRLNKEYEKAIADFTTAIELAPRSARFYAERGIVYDDLSEYEKAITDFTRAIELRPQEAGFYRMRGSAYNKVKEYEKAIADFSYAIELQPSNANLYSSRGYALFQSKAYEQAIVDYTRAITLDTASKSAYFWRGFAYLWLKERKLACADFVQHAALNPKNMYAAWMAIYSDLNKQRPGPEIIEAIEKIVAIDPQFDAALFCQGVALGLANNYGKAISQLENSLPSGRFMRDASFWKGLFYTYLGQSAEATQAITQALEAGLPPILLTPLYWLEQEQPEIYQTVVVPFLAQYDI